MTDDNEEYVRVKTTKYDRREWAICERLTTKYDRR